MTRGAGAVVLTVALPAPVRPASTKTFEATLRLLVMMGASIEPDDEELHVRLLVSRNEFGIEGLSARLLVPWTAARRRWHGRPSRG